MTFFECQTCDRISANPFPPDHTVTCALRAILAELETLTDLVRESRLEPATEPEEGGP